MLRFIVSETGVIPNHSNIYPNGYQILAKNDIVFLPFSSTIINTGLILKCSNSDFIHFVIDNTYQNLLNVDNSIIDNLIYTPHDIVIKNLTNNNITINKNSNMCHFYSKNKAYIYNTTLQDNFIKNKPFVQQIINSNIISENNIISHESIISKVLDVVVGKIIENVEEVRPEVVEEVRPEVVEEVLPEVVEEVLPEVVEEVLPEVVEEVRPEVVEEVRPEVVEEVRPEVVEEVQPEVVEEVQPEAVEQVKYIVIENENHLDVEEVDSDINDDVHDDLHNEVNLDSTTPAQTNANIIKRKYIRKKKTIINIPLA